MITNFVDKDFRSEWWDVERAALRRPFFSRQNKGLGMATVAQCLDELKARQARVTEAYTNGWRDCIQAERETASEFQFAFSEMLIASIEELRRVAGSVELGELPIGLGLSYSTEDD